MRLSPLMLALLSSPPCAHHLWNWLRGLGGPGLILLGILDSTPFMAIPAAGAEIFVILLVAHDRALWAYYAGMLTLGEMIGGYLTYRVSEKGGEKFIEKKLGRRRLKKVDRWFEKRGMLVVLIGSLLPPPFPFTSVLISAGVSQYPRNKMLISLLVGRGVRYFTLAYVAQIWGKQISSFLAANYQPMLYALFGLAALTAIGALVYFKWYRPKMQT